MFHSILRILGKIVKAVLIVIVVFFLLCLVTAWI